MPESLAELCCLPSNVPAQGSEWTGAGDRVGGGALTDLVHWNPTHPTACGVLHTHAHHPRVAAIFWEDPLGTLPALALSLISLISIFLLSLTNLCVLSFVNLL